MVARFHSVLGATVRRELAEHRLNRFLHVHLTLCAVAGLLPLLTPDAMERSVPAWASHAVIYCLSLSALLLGLSAAHGDADEFSILFTQPVGRAAWLAGKAAALIALLVPASLLLVVPALVLDGLTALLPLVAAAAAGVCVALAMLGLAVGLWIRDNVRGLLAALGLWFVLLCGIDLALLAVSGSSWGRDHQQAWVLPVMLNPLSALRVTMMFALERTAPAGIDSDALVGWWLSHPMAWLVCLLSAWTALLFGLGVLGARRRIDL
jgi:Cu-processing system permease protein